MQPKLWLFAIPRKNAMKPSCSTARDRLSIKLRRESSVTFGRQRHGKWTGPDDKEVEVSCNRVQECHANCEASAWQSLFQIVSEESSSLGIN
ncbi:hypothetical protein NC651_037388 [Populus alba x Populus x berolinensis]|nr:hypothetical protein NC651_037388 [Populus alba x Populus x berolinensis]